VDDDEEDAAECIDDELFCDRTVMEGAAAAIWG